jgi:Tfp pilus assembly pilus retraction ATPase PilT
MLPPTDGHAVLLRSSQIPLMLTGTSQAPLSMPALTSEQMVQIVSEVVPQSVHSRLRESGSVEYVVPAFNGRPSLSVTAIGNGNGNDLWLEVRPVVTADRTVPTERSAPEPRGTDAVAAHAAAVPQTSIAPNIAVAPNTGVAPKTSVASNTSAAARTPVATKSSAVARTRITSFQDVVPLITRLAAYGDSSLFLHGGFVPAAKIDGAVQWLDEFEPLSDDDLGRLLLELSSEIERGGGVERDNMLCWTVPDVAVVESRACVASPTVQISFRIRSTAPVNADRLGLPAAVTKTCRSEYGVLVLAGLSAEHVSRTCHSLVDLVNRECPHHVIVLERQVSVRHTRAAAFLSQRVVSGEDDAWAGALMAALAESPDMLVTEHIPSWQTMTELMAHASRTLIVLRVDAPTTIAAIKRLTELAPPAERTGALAELAESLAGVMAQCEVKPRGADAIAIYELLTANPTVRDLIAQGSFEQLALTLERGSDGMIPMSAALEELDRGGRADSKRVDVIRTEPAPGPARLESRAPVSAYAEQSEERVVPLP